jgi:hypothetical protein
MDHASWRFLHVACVCISLDQLGVTRARPSRLWRSRVSSTVGSPAGSCQIPSGIRIRIAPCPSLGPRARGLLFKGSCVRLSR